MRAVPAFCMLPVASMLQDWPREPVYRTLAAFQFRGMASSVTFSSFVVGFAAVRSSLPILIFMAALRRSHSRLR